LKTNYWNEISYSLAKWLWGITLSRSVFKFSITRTISESQRSMVTPMFGCKSMRHSLS